jgi:hypothetical protein
MYEKLMVHGLLLACVLRSVFVLQPHANKKGGGGGWEEEKVYTIPPEEERRRSFK